ncbi:MAG: metallophosphoesterase family protein [Bacillota bacterium]
MRIGLISDTHIPARAKAIPREVLEAFAGVDLILHAGDLVVPQVLEPLERIAPLVAVAGNNDPPAVAERWGWQRVLELEGFRVGLVHGHEGRGANTVARALSQFPACDVVVFGHSHSAYNQRHGRTLAVNPGSPTDLRRWSPGHSYGLLHLEPGREPRAEIRFLPPRGRNG